MKKTSRRTFLQSLAGAGLAGAAASLFPWLGHVRADGPAQKKLLLYFTPHGTIWDQWRPSGGETSFALSPILAPLERHRSSISIIDGLAMHAPYAHRVPHTYDMVSVFTGSPIDTTARSTRVPTTASASAGIQVPRSTKPSHRG